MELERKIKARAAIFDLDGTLVDSLEDLADSVNAMLAEYGYSGHDLEKYRYFVGNGTQKLIERSLPEEDVADTAFLRQAIGRYKEIYAEHILDKTHPYDGILAMLTELRQRKIPIGICTNKHQSAAERIVRELFPDIAFDSIMGDRDGLPRKPDPKKVLMMAEDFGVQPSEVAYLGDSGVDMDTAKNAGFIAIGVLWGFRGRDELLEHGAQMLLHVPGELFSRMKFVR